mgnify:CR=1 FL=1
MDPVFLVCAIVSGISAVLVVRNRNPVYSALSLMLCFLAFAVIFLRIGATFLAAMHVLDKRAIGVPQLAGVVVETR